MFGILFSSTNYFGLFFGGSQIKIDSHHSRFCDIEMPTRIIYKRRKEKERRLAQLLLIATAVLAIGRAGIAACFTAIGHVDAVLRSELPEFSWKRW